MTLCALDAVRPSYQWMHNHSLQYGLVPGLRHPDDARKLHQELETLGVTERHVQITMRMAGKLQARLGKRLTQLTGEDLMNYPRGIDVALQPSRNGLSTLWKGLHRLGWLVHESRVLPSVHRQRGQLSSEELVARHGVTGEFAEVLAEYLKHRSARLDYGSRRVHADYLVRLFWKDILEHHPEQQDFRLTPEQAEAWKQRLRVRTDGTPRGDVHPVPFAVRGFYLDVAPVGFTGLLLGPLGSGYPHPHVRAQGVRQVSTTAKQSNQAAHPHPGPPPASSGRQGRAEPEGNGRRPGVRGQGEIRG